MSLLTEDAITRELETLPGWTHDGKAIRKQFTFKGFPEAVAFVQRLIPGCEAADHHPDVRSTKEGSVVVPPRTARAVLTPKGFTGAGSRSKVPTRRYDYEDGQSVKPTG